VGSRKVGRASATLYRKVKALSCQPERAPTLREVRVLTVRVAA
jgi:hypothetical protein